MKKLQELQGTKGSMIKDNEGYLRKQFKKNAQQQSRVLEKMKQVIPILQKIDKDMEFFIYPNKQQIQTGLYRTPTFDGVLLANLMFQSTLDDDTATGMIVHAPQLWEALLRLDAVRICHSDIENNIMFDKEKGYRIIDFDDATVSTAKCNDFHLVKQLLHNIYNTNRDNLSAENIYHKFIPLLRDNQCSLNKYKEKWQVQLAQTNQKDGEFPPSVIATIATGTLFTLGGGVLLILHLLHRRVFGTTI